MLHNDEDSLAKIDMAILAVSFIPVIEHVKHHAHTPMSNGSGRVTLYNKTITGQ